MDMHLNFIVDQTEKYSSWLIESLATNANKDATNNSQLTPNTSIGTDEPANTTEDEDIEFDGDKIETESDDESTIAKEERIDQSDLEIKDKAEAKVQEELRQLQLENEQSLDALLKEYNLDEQYFKSTLDAGGGLRADPTRSDRLERRKRTQERERLGGMDVDKDGGDADDDDGEQDSLGTTDLSETDEDESTGESEAENEASASSAGGGDVSGDKEDEEEMDAEEESNLKGGYFFDVQYYTQILLARSDLGKLMTITYFKGLLYILGSIYV